MIMNSWKADGSVNSPWLHADATASIRSAIGLRLHLMPYLYTLMREASVRHTPVLRPTFFHFGDDAKCWADSDEMMVGEDLLVAPVFEAGARQRTVYLPHGAHGAGWFEYWTQTFFEGGQTVTVDAPLDRLPLFVRAGALLPTTDTASDLAKTEEGSRALRYFPVPVAPGASESEARLFEDNGLQTTFASDECVTHAFHALASADSLQLSVTSEGTWTLPYSSIRVVLPTAEKRALQLPANGLLRLS